MTLVDSLPTRPLDDGEVAALNRSDAVELAIAVDDDDTPTDAVLLATASWVKALLLTDDGWEVVETVSLDDVERYEALRVCEETVRDARTDE
ncbi:hypothetical protein SAMN04487950_2703 [Halogranum rubrum]|uniref:DUF7964 domain-containing protein n=1 Tax=Halogranum rubrum TaxID=553466 RepID=A0A1I4F8N6_9EURY|nr:hypothetical protein [Halogranum rubrum]SFL14328.1 hypothetical protein SAMN04487950_2703 [Halogranum rubrum]